MSMDNKLTILTGKFSDEEKFLILKKYPEKEEDLNFYQETNYFQIHKLYFKRSFLGYVVLFLGHHSLEKNDVLIDDIGFLRDETLLEPLMFKMLKRIKEQKVFSVPLEDIYYEPSKFDSIYQEMFHSLGFREDDRSYVGHNCCR